VGEGRRRLAAGDDEVEVGSQLAIEALVASLAYRPARIDGGELVPTTRAATFLQLLAIMFLVHDGKR
jgi:hypothetical protein